MSIEPRQNRKLTAIITTKAAFWAFSQTYVSPDDIINNNYGRSTLDEQKTIVNTVSNDVRQLGYLILLVRSFWLRLHRAK